MNMQPNADFLRSLTATFLVEAREHVQVFGEGLLALGKAADLDTQLSLVESIFREAHCLKGAARAINAGEIERLCQKLEGMSAAIKSGKTDLSPEVIDGLHRSVTAVTSLIEAMEAGPQEVALAGPVAKAEPHVRQAPEPHARQAPEPHVRQAPEPHVRQAPKPHVRQAPKPHVRQAPGPLRGDGGNTVRIATHKLDAIFVQVEELLGVKLAQAERALELREMARRMAERERLWTEALPWVRSLRQQVEARAEGHECGGAAGAWPPEHAARLLAVLDQDRDHAAAMGDGMADLMRIMAHDRRRFDIMADRLLEDVKQVMMLPFEAILAGFPKMAYDMAGDVGKKIDFDIRGAEIPIDKRILEKIKDPLLHLVRNSIDHGIEAPADRSHCGKPPCGRVMLGISQAADKVMITVTDDGAGLDLSALKVAALHAGMLTAGEAEVLGDPDIPQLVFRSGVTTRQQVTSLSGRGLGMAIVEENVAKLSGTVGIESAPGVGTTVRIVLPMTLATLRGTVVQVANREFVIPTANVIRVARITRESIRRVENHESLCLDGTTLALVHLADVLGLVSGATTGGNQSLLTVMVLGYGATSIAIAVDQIIGEQEVLAKPLGRLLVRVQNVAAATVFGSGRVVPILSVPDLLQSAAGNIQSRRVEEVVESTRVRRLLVADDSITARTLLQCILESSGFSVKTVPDGTAALHTLQTEPFDLLVSDVEMPRMNGFELVKRLRAQPKLAELPVVLVTALEAKHDRERGLDAGANAFIVKSNFDQSNLLEVIERLI